MPGKEATKEDFKIIDNFIDLVAPEYEAKYNESVEKIRRAWGRILLTYCKGDG